MTTDQVIDDLLRDDEAELRAKRKRLKAFVLVLDELRKIQTGAAEAADELLKAGDLTKADAAKYFELTKVERGVLFPAIRTTNQVTVSQPTDSNSDDGTSAPEQ